MSKRTAPELHLEWASGQVQAVDVAANKTANGVTPADLAPLFSGRRDALVGLGRGLVFMKTVRLPKALPDDLRRILAVRMAQLFPLPPDQLAFDFIQTNDQTDEGFLTLVGAVRSRDLDQLNDELKQANLQPARVLPVALGSVVLAARASAPRAVVIERTATGLSLDVVQDGIVRLSRTVAAGSDPIAEAHRTMAAAEASDLAIVAAGGLSLPGAITVSETALAALSDAPAFAFERSEDRARAAQQRIATKTRFSMLMMVSALLLATLIWVERGDAQAEVTRSGGKWSRELSKVRSIRDAETAKAQRATGIETAVKGAFQPAQPLSDITAVISDNLPASIWLTGLTVERGKPIQIRGTATKADDVSVLVDRLGSDDRFREVRLVFANSARVDQTPVVQFSITATAVGNLPMPVPVKAKKGAATRTTGGSSAASSAAAGAQSGAAAGSSTR
jgi:Tfp pilus assembly protein PilN